MVTILHGTCMKHFHHCSALIGTPPKPEDTEFASLLALSVLPWAQPPSASNQTLKQSLDISCEKRQETTEGK